jgi:hypothetical protein
MKIKTAIVDQNNYPGSIPLEETDTIFFYVKKGGEFRQDVEPHE